MHYRGPYSGGEPCLWQCSRAGSRPSAGERDAIEEERERERERKIVKEKEQIAKEKRQFEAKMDEIVGAEDGYDYLQEVTLGMGAERFKGKIVDIASGQNTVLYCVKWNDDQHKPYQEKVWWTIKKIKLMQESTALDYEEEQEISKCVELNAGVQYRKDDSDEFVCEKRCTIS